MRRVKDIISESTPITEADVVKRNPLQPTVNREHFDNRDKVVVGDFEDDLDTLDGKINARGRASWLRQSDVDKARRMNNKVELFTNYEPILRELAKKLEDEGEWRLSLDVERIISSLEDIVPDEFDIRDAHRTTRERIFVGDPITHYPNYVGHKPAWS